MDTKKKATITGVGTILMAGAAYIAWKRSGKQRAKFGDWKKEKIHTAYFNSINEKDVAWG